MKGLMDSLYYTDQPGDKRPCAVEINGGVIKVNFEDEGQTIQYVGHELGHGHYEMLAPEIKGKATLHRFDNGKVLEGFWREGGVQGMWRISLIEGRVPE